MGRAGQKESMELSEIIQLVWDSKWFLTIGTTMLLLATHLIITFLIETSYHSRTQVRAISSELFSKYYAMNAFSPIRIVPENNRTTYFKNEVWERLDQLSQRIDLIQESQRFGIQEKDLFSLKDLFIEQIKDKDLMVDVFRRRNILNRIEYKSDDLYEQALQNHAQKVMVLPANRSREEWEIHMKVKNRREWQSVLSDMEKLATERVRKILDKAIENQVAFENLRVKNKIEKLDTDFEEKVAAKKLNRLQKKFKLERHIEIAKRLRLEFPLNTADFLRAEAPMYFRGYRALNEELALLHESKNDYQSEVALHQLSKRRYQEESRKLIHRLEKFYAESPAADKEGFVVVTPLLSETSFHVTFKKRKIMLLTFLLGLFFSFASFLLYKRLRSTSQFIDN